MEENIELVNSERNEFINKSVMSPLKAGKILMIVGWSLLIFNVGIFVIWAGCYVIGIQLIRKQRIAHGLCMMLFGAFSLGIWPFVVAVKEMKKPENETFDVTSDNFKKSTIRGYNVATILLAIGAPILWIGLIFGLCSDVTIFFWIGYIIAACGNVFLVVQDFRRDKIAHGVCIDFFGLISLGIWPLLYAIRQKKVLTKEVLDGEASNIVKQEINPIVAEESADNMNTVNENNNGNNTGIKALLIVLIVIASIVAVFLTFVIINASTKSSHASYTIYDAIYIDESYETKADEQVMVPKTYEYSVDTDSLDQVVVCGEDIPVGEYTIDLEDSDDDFNAYIQDRGEVLSAGDELYDGATFNCEEGKQVRYGDYEGTVTFASSTETVPLQETKTIETTMTTSYHKNGEVDEVTCEQDYEEVECSSLPNYDDLLAQTQAEYESGENKTEVVETMEKRLFSTTCTSSESGTIDCEEAVMYEELLENLE